MLGENIELCIAGNSCLFLPYYALCTIYYVVIWIKPLDLFLPYHALCTIYYVVIWIKPLGVK